MLRSKPNESLRAVIRSLQAELEVEPKVCLHARIAQHSTARGLDLLAEGVQFLYLFAVNA